MRQSRFCFEQGRTDTGLQLFWRCQSLAQQSAHRYRGEALLPSGARIFYYTRRLLLAHDALPELHPDEVMLSERVVERFLQAAPLVAERLVDDFPRAVQVRAFPILEVRRSLSTQPVLSVPERTWKPGYQESPSEGLQQIWERLWEICWRERKQEHLARLWALIGPDRLRVAPVARLADSPQVALRLLRAQLAQDAERGWRIPAAGAYLYDEPLEIWLLRSFMTEQRISLLCQALANHP